MPSKMRVGGSHHALREEKVDDVDEDDAGRSEDLCGDVKRDIGGEADGDDAEDCGRYACHGEALCVLVGEYLGIQGQRNGPKRRPDMRNLWPLALFSWKMVMCAIALHMNRNKKTAVIGISVPILGMPPSVQT